MNTESQPTFPSQNNPTLDSSARQGGLTEILDSSMRSGQSFPQQQDTTGQTMVNSLSNKDNVLLQENGGPVAPDAKVAIQVQLPPMNNGNIAAQQAQEEEEKIAAQNYDEITVDDIATNSQEVAYQSQSKAAARNEDE